MSAMAEQALRLPTPTEPGQFPEGFDISRICYWFDRIWYLYLPRGGLGNLAGHQVTEHEDGTITVSPSVLLTSTRKGSANPDKRRHGFLKRGAWESCPDDQPPTPITSPEEAPRG